MNNYYLLRGESSPLSVGIKNGESQAQIERDGYRNPDKFDILIRQLGTNYYWEIKDSIADLDYDVEYVRLLPDAKRTHFLQFGPSLMNCPFLVSRLVVSVLAEYKLQKYRFFNAKVVRDGESWDYSLLFLSPQYDNLINYEKSVFYTGNELSGKQFHVFRNAKEKLEFSKNNFGLKIKKFHLLDRFNNLDLFSISGAEIGMSERLKNHLESRELATGVKILPAFGDVSWATINQ
jgi:hypothetical protein